MPTGAADLAAFLSAAVSASDGPVVWLAPAGGSADAAVLPAVLSALSEAAVPVRVLHGSHDLPGAHLLDVVSVMDTLRVSCPWDREQTHASLVPYLLEEAYEAIETVEAGDLASLREELGDVLLQVLFHARIAAERSADDGGFTVDDVADTLAAKLTRRHPHVFGSVSVSSAAVFWYSYVGMFVPTVWLAVLGATLASVTKDTDPAKMVSAVFGGVMTILVLLMVLHGPIATNILNVYSAALAALSMGLRLSRTVIALIAGVVGYLVTIYFVFQPSFAKAFDNWMISLLLWMSPWAGIILTDFFLVRHGRVDVPELYRAPDESAYGDINWGAIVAFLVGLVAGWSVEDGLVPALQGPISTKLLSGADLSWLVGIVVAGGVYLALGRRVAPAPVPQPTGSARR